MKTKILSNHMSQYFIDIFNILTFPEFGLDTLHMLLNIFYEHIKKVFLKVSKINSGKLIFDIYFFWNLSLACFCDGDGVCFWH